MGKDVDVEVPQPFEIDLDLDPISVFTNSNISSNNNIALTGDPESPISVGPLTVNPLSVDLGLNDVNVDMGLDDVNVDMGLDNINMCMSFAVTEFPSMRVHFPVDLDFGLKIFGMPVINFGIFGKAMVVTEDNPKKVFYTPKKNTGKRSKNEASDTIKVSIEEK